MDPICGSQSNKVGTRKLRQLQPLFFCLVYGCGHLPKNPSKQILAFHICRQPHLTTLAHQPLLTSHTLKMAKESQMTRNNARYEPYNSSRRPNRRRESPSLNSSGNQGIIHQNQPDTGIYMFLDDLYRLYGGPDMAQLFRKYAGQSGVLGEAIEMWLLFKDVSTLVTSSFRVPFQTDARWVVRCANVARQTLSALPRLQRFIP